MQKCLQLLPLCYAADGILSFAIASYADQTSPYIYGDYTRFTPLIHDHDFGDLQLDPNWSAYEMLTEANSKINVYGPIIKGLTWVSAEPIMVEELHPEVTISTVGLESFVVNPEVPLTNPPHPFYEGYVQCGYYHDIANNPSFMLVNRRAVYRIDDETSVIPINVDASFSDAPSQSVTFTFNTDTVSQYGGRLGLFDPYSHDISVADTNRCANVTIGPGDGSLRQLVPVLPATVTCTYTLNRDIYALGEVNIHNGGIVTIQANRILTTYPNTTIYVTNNSILRITGSLVATDSTIIHVESGSTLDLTNAVCQWGVGAGVIADCSSIIINNTTLAEVDTPNIWKGITCSNSNISFINSQIEAADTTLSLNNCNLNMESSTIVVPDNGTGIKITGSERSPAIHITGNNDERSKFYSNGSGTNRTAKGIVYDQAANSLIIDHVDFDNLSRAIGFIASCEVPDSIYDCSFNGCFYGIDIEGAHGLQSIRNCAFNAVSQGIGTSYYQPFINNCSFIGGANEFGLSSGDGVGILLDYVTGNVQREIPAEYLRGDITGCSFENLSYGILARQSSSRICANSFLQNRIGLGITSTSFLDCTSNARNIFANTDANMRLDNLRSNGQPTVLSFLQLKWGHNQFYQPESEYDFIFPFNFGTYSNGVVNADGNYWDDCSISTNPTTNYIYANYVDQVPYQIYNTIYNPDRFDNAVVLQDSCQYEDASVAFRDILSDRLENESSNWGSSVDRSYLCTLYGNLDLYDLIDYLQAQIDQSPDSLNELRLLIRDYQAKTYIALEDYQSAADLIELVLEDPESEVDSLNAVLDLEICYLLASLSQSKRPLNTNYTQYRYPDVPTYKVNHRRHLEQLLALVRTGDDVVPTPNRVFLSHNYPNPFNPSTTIEFGVPKTTKVKLSIYNIRGQLVKELVNQSYEPGKYKAVWEGKNSSGNFVASGVYFYRLEAGGKCFTHKMLLLK